MVLTTWFEKEICVTCQYWQGERSLEFRSSKLYGIRHQDKQGRSPVKDNVLRNGQMPKCLQYKRWVELP